MPQYSIYRIKDCVLSHYSGRPPHYVTYHINQLFNECKTGHMKGALNQESILAYPMESEYREMLSSVNRLKSSEVVNKQEVQNKHGWFSLQHIIGGIPSHDTAIAPVLDGSFKGFVRFRVDRLLCSFWA